MEPENTFAQTEQAASQADLEAIEREYAFILPADYKNHLLAVNGGFPRRDTFTVPLAPGGGKHTVAVNKFKPVKHGRGTLERSLESLHDQIHSDLVPFANDAGGDQFCLSVGPEDYGSVYYISHESYTPPKSKERKVSRQYGKGVIFLAPSFTTFMQGLMDVPDE